MCVSWRMAYSWKSCRQEGPANKLTQKSVLTVSLWQILEQRAGRRGALQTNCVPEPPAMFGLLLLGWAVAVAATAAQRGRACTPVLATCSQQRSGSCAWSGCAKKHQASHAVVCRYFRKAYAKTATLHRCWPNRANSSRS